MTARRPRRCSPRRSSKRVCATSPPARTRRVSSAASRRPSPRRSSRSRSRAKEVDDKSQIAQVATISAADTAIGEVIADAIDKVGKDGTVTVEESNTFGIELELTEGMQFDKGYLSPYFVTDPERQEAVLEDAYILFTSSKISAVHDLVPVLEKVMQSGRPLLIIAEDVDGEALATLVVNKIRGTFTSVAVKAPGFGERRKAMLQDMAILTGGDGDLRGDRPQARVGATIDLLGRARRVVVTKDATTIVDGGGAKADVAGRVAQIKREIEDTDSDWDREKLQERLAKLAGGVAVVKVGAATEVELKEKKHRIEDALSATRAAIDEGIVAGGGTALVRARAAVDKLVDDAERRRGDRRADRGATPSRRRCATSRPTPASRAPCKVREVADAKGTIGLNAHDRRARVDLVEGGRHRPGQGDPLGAAERRLDRGAAAHHRGHRGRQARDRPACRRRHGRRHGRHGRDDVAPPGSQRKGRVGDDPAVCFGEAPVERVSLPGRDVGAVVVAGPVRWRRTSGSRPMGPQYARWRGGYPLIGSIKVCGRRPSGQLAGTTPMPALWNTSMSCAAVVRTGRVGPVTLAA